MRNENTLKGYKIQVGPRWKLRINRMRLDMSAKKIQKESGRGKAKESECAEAKLLPWNASNRYQQKIKIGTSHQEKKIKN